MNKDKSVKTFMDQMGTLRVTIPEELDRQFREAIFRARGMRRGNITVAMQEAIEMWILAQEKKRVE